jgi:ATP adenylyltransferase
LESSSNRSRGIAVDFGRFEAALSRSGSPRPPYDEVLLEVSGCVITPTLGSIVPNWLLVIPSIPALNFAEWRSNTGMEPDQLVADVLEKCGVSGDRAIWFEHGASNRGSAIGCGIDHAHLHIIIDAPFSFDDFAIAAQRSSRVSWKEQAAFGVYTSILTVTSYLVAASTTRALVAEEVDTAGSQFFRRVIANLVGRPHTWDYKAHPHIMNVQKTLCAFGDQAGQRIAR